MDWLTCKSMNQPGLLLSGECVGKFIGVAPLTIGPAGGERRKVMQTCLAYVIHPCSVNYAQTRPISVLFE